MDINTCDFKTISQCLCFPVILQMIQPPRWRDNHKTHEGAQGANYTYTSFLPTGMAQSTKTCALVLRISEPHSKILVSPTENLPATSQQAGNCLHPWVSPTMTPSLIAATHVCPFRCVHCHTHRQANSSSTTWGVLAIYNCFQGACLPSVNWKPGTASSMIQPMCVPHAHGGQQVLRMSVL